MSAQAKRKKDNENQTPPGGSESPQRLLSELRKVTTSIMCRSDKAADAGGGDDEPIGYAGQHREGVTEHDFAASHLSEALLGLL
mmetsp:Transcript_6275/g.8912  ORF Transcript_6275/g.8912 Transcript_6275/m.8912 type:complete len:84 (+) Transcript_6275:286-537(+)